MAAFDDESLCSTERLLNPERSSIDFEGEQRNLKISPNNGLWGRIWQRRLSFLFHLAIIAAYTIGFLLTLRHFAKECENGPDLVKCELS
jgi:hypothetical protein